MGEGYEGRGALGDRNPPPCPDGMSKTSWRRALAL